MNDIEPMRICVFGAGAIGGHLATRLAGAGHDTSVLARGDHLAAIRAQGGLAMKVGDAELFAAVRASERPADLGAQDLVIVALKATALAAVAGSIGPLLGAQTMVLFVQNGIPWWYAQGLGAARPAPPDLARLDPGGALARAIAAERVLGAVIYTSNEVVAPGRIVNDSVAANHLIVGETDDADTPRVRALRKALEAADVGSPPCADIRAALWRRLVVNIAGSVVCSIIEAPVGAAQADPDIGKLYERLAAEVGAVAAAHGVDVSAGTAPHGAPYRFAPQHKSSILQDYERRRPMEIEAILKAPLSFAHAAGVAVPALEVVTALAAHRAARLGLYRP